MHCILSQESAICGASFVNVATLLQLSIGAILLPTLKKKEKTMRVYLDPTDTAGQEKMAEALQACGVAKLVYGQEMTADVQLKKAGGQLCFDFEKVSKHDVMMTFLTLYERGLIIGTKDALQTFLATSSNLGNKESVHKLYVRCLQEYVRKGH